MSVCLPPPRIERARPLLGTVVAIRAHDAEDVRAQRAIDAAFGEIAKVHAAMSFHEPGSDVSRLNREAFHRSIRIGPDTTAVLRLARSLAMHTDGVFDIATAAQLVERGLLPRPDSAYEPDPRASWRDIELGADDSVRFRRPLWIDLGGIAKGYAVDRAVARLRQLGVRQCCVNAGGDLRATGPAPERIELRTDARPSAPEAVVELQNGSLASSGHWPDDAAAAAHVDGISRRPVSGAFVCVIAKRCVIADALTKPVLALRARCVPLLDRFRATAHLLEEDGTWRQFGATG